MKLREKMQELHQEKLDVLKKRGSLSRYGSGVCFASGIIALFTVPIASPILFGLSGSLVAAESNKEEKIKSKIRAIETEEKNLSKSSYTGIDSAPKANAIRNNKIKALEERKAAQETKVAGSKFVNALLNIGVVVSACVGLANPGLLSFITPVIAGIKLYQNKGLYKNINDLNQTQAQINSLKNEYRFASEYPLRKQPIKQNVVEKKPVQAKQRATVKTSRMPVNQTVRATQPRMAADYYNNMFFTGKSQGENAKVYQKVRA